MKISAVYIAKNEAKNIARSLDSIKGTADELILVDTGSTDDTVEIFKSYGGRVYVRKWDDDFSAPRNMAISKATGDWIIILDADESFSKETRQNIRTVLESCSPEAKGLLINMVNYDKDTGEALDEFYALRIVRNIQGLNYQGRIHEMLHIGDVPFYVTKRVSRELLSIDHTGYSTSISMEKNKRNLRMMQAAIAAGDPEERYYTNLYETYGALGDKEKSLYYAKLDVARGRQPITYASRSYRGLLAHYSKDTSLVGKLERFKFARQGIKDFPELPDFHAEYSEALYQLASYGKARDEIELAISLLENYDGLEPCLLSDEMIPVMEKRKKEITELAGKYPDVKISACVIVKNEESNITNWLENVSVFADEIIINDTGSEDETKELITRFSEDNPDMPIVLLENDWQDDFSLAKNQCIAEATGNWLVFTDADELFVEPNFVRGYLSYIRLNKELQALYVPMANVDKDNNNRVINYFNALRIFRKLPGIHYEGRIHEQLVKAEAGAEALNARVADKCLLINHTGYSTKISTKKAQRNIKLLQQDIAAGQDIRKTYRYLAEGYYMLGNYEQALNNALLATQSPYQPLGQQGDMYWLAFNAMEKLNYDFEDEVVLADTGIRLFPKLPDFYGRKGMLLTEHEQYQAAIQCFEQAMERLEAYNNQDVPVESSSIASILHELYADLGICLRETGERAAAEAMFKTALTINPWTEVAISGWADMYNGTPDEKFIAELTAIYKEESGYKAILTNIFSDNGLIELAEYFGSEEVNPLIMVKSYPWLYNQSMKEIAAILPYLFVCLLEKYDEDYVRILPVKLGNIVKYIHGLIGEVAIKGHYNEYSTFIKEVFTMATDATIEKYLDILPMVSADMTEFEEQLINVAGLLRECNKPEYALQLYNLIPAESEGVNEHYWQQVGICFYDLQRYEVALECFSRGVQDNTAATYVAWCQEAMENGH
ncbi:glycosyltransferase [Anaerovibrio lipolyticus]|uniref:glycosyltransferase n=1 Tax=Anaerovibrio lipolyticus TaxID=82374 RepID=UPI0004853E16|nr:glycosyltransferase [Anaerovibrio lipolyticus]